MTEERFPADPEKTVTPRVEGQIADSGIARRTGWLGLDNDEAATAVGGADLAAPTNAVPSPP
jgi:hypothetical protein